MSMQLKLSHVYNKVQISFCLNYTSDAHSRLKKCLTIKNLFSGDGLKRNSHPSSRSGSRKNRGYSIGLGRSQSGGMSEEVEDVLLHNSRLHFLFLAHISVLGKALSFLDQ